MTTNQKEKQLATLQTAHIYAVMDLMNQWGFTKADDPGERRGELWWAGFSRNNKSVYAWESTADKAVRQAAIKAVKEL